MISTGIHTGASTANRTTAAPTKPATAAKVASANSTDAVALSAATWEARGLNIIAALNDGILPADYYALPEQHAAGFGSDVQTLQAAQNDKDGSAEPSSPTRGSRSA